MYKIATEPASEPMTTATIKTYLKVDHSNDDTLIGNLAKAVRKNLEDELRKVFITQTWDLYLDKFEDLILLEKSPVTSVTHVKYYDSDNSLQTLADTVYDTDIISEPARITLGYSQTWPTIYNRTNAVVIRFVAGYTDAASVPDDIKQIMLLLISYYYDNRGEEMTQARIKAVMQSAGWLINKQRLFRF